MKIVASVGCEDIAQVYLAEMKPKKYIECVQSLQPPLPRLEKWVLIVSTLYGCPVGCSICDAGGWYGGKLNTREIMAQINFLTSLYFPDGIIPVKKFKIQFARMGEPALNPHVIEVLANLPEKVEAPGLMPSISTIAPHGTENFFRDLICVKETHYKNGKFQLQFSLHTTDEIKRDEMIPIKKWNLKEIAEYGKEYYQPGDRKITLNFALTDESQICRQTMNSYFNPDIFLIKLTPVNPTIRVIKGKIPNAIKSEDQAERMEIVEQLRADGYEVIISIGEWEENKIGSNCGQYVKKFTDGNFNLSEETYQYKVLEFNRSF
jgi:23S rRNA (adenine2503-C2)-methyltransferase